MKSQPMDPVEEVKILREYLDLLAPAIQRLLQFAGHPPQDMCFSPKDLLRAQELKAIIYPDDAVVDTMIDKLTRDGKLDSTDLDALEKLLTELR